MYTLNVSVDFKTAEELAAFVAALNAPQQPDRVWTPCGTESVEIPASPPEPKAEQPTDLRAVIAKFVADHAHDTAFRSQVKDVFLRHGGKKLSEIKDAALGFLLADLHSLAGETQYGQG